MKLLFKFIILLIILALVVLSVWGEWLLEKAGAYIFQTTVDINKVKFMPHRLIFNLYGINLPEKNILIPRGAIFLFPPRLEFYGLKVMGRILLAENGFSLNVSRHKYWEISVLFKGLDLSKMDYGFTKGVLSGTVDGIYSKGNCELYGVLYLNNIIYSGTNGGIMGISPDEFKKIIETRNGSLELDFTYKGPIGGLTELYRYRPGKKTLALIKTYLIEKVKKGA